MATDTETTEPRTKVLSNGAVYDVDKKKIVSGAVLTSDRAREMVQARVEKKRERVMAGAAKFLEATGQWEAPTDLDVVEAIAEQVMETAMDTDPKNSKQIKAADWIMENMGLSERENTATPQTLPAGTVLAASSTLLALAAQLEAEIAARVARAQAVDGEVADAG